MALKGNAAAQQTGGKTYSDWTTVTDDIKVIGNAERFSISFEVSKDIVFGFNGCRIAHTKDGKPFISFSAWKDKDGAYHQHTYVKIPTEMSDAIIAMF